MKLKQVKFDRKTKEKIIEEIDFVENKSVEKTYNLEQMQKDIEMLKSK